MSTENQLIFEKYIKSLKEATLGTETMTVEELKNYLMEIKGPTPVTVEIEAPAKMLKRENPYLGTIKRSVINGMAGGDYEIGAQNRELAAHEGDPNYIPTFKAESLWKGKGKRVAPVVVQHIETGEYYLAIGTPRSGSSTYTFQGQPIEKEQIDRWLIKPSVSTKQQEVGIAPENTLQPRYPLLKNIKRIKIQNFDLHIV